MSTIIERSTTEHVKTSSSCVKSMSYHSKTGSLYVTFPNGDTYRYFDVPLWEWLHFGVVAEIDGSLGRFFNRYIRGRYDYIKEDRNGETTQEHLHGTEQGG